LRIKYQRLVDHNEQLASEIQDLRGVAKEKEITFKEMEELNKFNDNLLHEMSRMRSEVTNIHLYHWRLLTVLSFTS